MVCFSAGAHSTKPAQLDWVDPTKRGNCLSHAVQRGGHRGMVEAPPRKEEVDDPVGEPVRTDGGCLDAPGGQYGLQVAGSVDGAGYHRIWSVGTAELR